MENNPCFDNVHFNLNFGDVEVSVVRNRYEDIDGEESRNLYEEPDPGFVANYRKYKTMCDEIEALCK